MRYSLLSRFRGAILGAAIGEIWGAYGEWWQLEREALAAHTGWGNLVVRGTEGLIRHGQLDLADWRDSPIQIIEAPAPLSSSEASPGLGKRGKKTSVALNGENSSPDANQETSLTRNSDTSLSGAVIATVPVALFFHEDEAKLRQNLQQVADVWQDNSVVKDGPLAIGYAIAQALKERLDPVTLIPQTLAYLDAETPLVKQLRQVQTLLEEGAGLETTLKQLLPHQDAPPPNLPIALAFYCCLSTLEDLRLSVVRATRCPQPQMTSAIAGALSGAYNSTAGIPVSWRLALSQHTEARSPLETLWGVNSEAELLRLASRLLATWSGVYDADKFLIDPSQVPAVAAPKVIKPR